MLENLIVWNNGYKKMSEVCISPLDFGFIHSDATYEVMRAEKGHIKYLEDHIERYTKSCEFYGFAPIDDLKGKAEYLLEANNLSDAFIWLCNWRGAPASGSPRDLSGEEKEFMYAKPYYGISTKHITLCLVKDFPRASTHQEYKNFCWRELTHAQRVASQRGFDSGLVLDIEGNINEGPGFGICFVSDGKVITPKKDVLDSITIKNVEKICRKNHIEFNRCDISDYKHNEAFICSTSGGITPVERIEDWTYSHEMTQKLMELFNS